jgi:Xaa-Pro aminopeptidase
MDADKLARLDRYLDREGLAAVWFARPNNFAWLAGGDNVVDASDPTGVAAAGYDGEAVTVVTNNIEAPRLREEEVDARVVEHPWYEGGLADGVRTESPTPAAADFDVPGFDAVERAPFRQPLTDRDIEAYRMLGADTARAVEAAAAAATPDTTEAELAGALREHLGRRGIAAPVALVGGGDRAGRYRHYTPKQEPLGGYALVSVTAVRDGLHASTTRSVAFDPPAWLVDRTRKAARVEATALAATRAAGREGGTAADVFAAIQEAYATVGHEGEWKHHHQGGAAGYAGREWVATPDSDAPVELPMAYAWNPTIQGAKSEDTWLVTEDGFERLTAGLWPTVEVEAVGYDDTLARPLPG